jgi:hypothetical protein
VSFGPERVGELLDERRRGHFEELGVRRRCCVQYGAPRRGVFAALLDGMAKTFAELGRFDGSMRARHEW